MRRTALPDLLLTADSGWMFLARREIDVTLPYEQQLAAVEALPLRTAGAWSHPLLGCRLRAGPGRDFVVRGWALPRETPTVRSLRRPVGESLPYPTPEETA